MPLHCQGKCAWLLRLNGRVQGVGFRPFVYRLAAKLGIAGTICNDSTGVIIFAEADSPQQLETFRRRLTTELPPAAKITELQIQPAEPRGLGDFEIVTSHRGRRPQTQVSPDLATCEQCLRELADPADRRYRYPFINCTNCGPRYTIIRTIPYDRPATTMSAFKMCDYCKRQYEDPTDRRFHAQPVACGRCGPRIRLTDREGRTIETDKPIELLAEHLRAGRIAAIKGIGGFHLAVRADSDDAVRRLRERKKRDAKPLAMMVKDLRMAERIVELSEPARRELGSPRAPILLLPKRQPNNISPAVAPAVERFGVMLPYTPLHRMLFEQLDFPLVMTSGNLSDEPLAAENGEALQRLGSIADVFCMHDRDIYRRIDDSVLQMNAGAAQLLRRARGYVPEPIELPLELELPVLAVGADLKNTVCIGRKTEAIISEHIGDLADGIAYENFLRACEHLQQLFELRPEALVCDMHPGYLSGRYARQFGVPVLAVQHHHAHAAAVMAEHHLGAEQNVIALVADGTGFGTDGAIWGCECLHAGYARFERLGHLQYFRLPGGESACVQAYRPAVSLLMQSFGKLPAGPWMDRLGPDARSRRFVAEMLTAGLNSPKCSSLGRLFDAVGCLCGAGDTNRYEAQIPMQLEALADARCTQSYPFRLLGEGPPWRVDPSPMIRQLLADIAAGVEVGTISAKFHNTVVEFLAALAEKARRYRNTPTAALSGGAFCNRYITERLVRKLKQMGFQRVLLHRDTPPNDGAISLGQIAVAAARLREGSFPAAGR